MENKKLSWYTWKDRDGYTVISVTDGVNTLTMSVAPQNVNKGTPQLIRRLTQAMEIYNGR